MSALYLLDRPPSQGATAHRSATVEKGLADVELLVKFLVYRQFDYFEKEEDEEDDPNFVLPDALGQLTLDENTRFVGFNGRCNKVADTCYCWWVGGTLQVRGRPDGVSEQY